MTLKYGQHHWKWYEHINLHHHLKFGISHIFNIWEGISHIYDTWENSNVFSTSPNTWPTQNKLHSPFDYTTVTQIILTLLCMIFFIYVATNHIDIIVLDLFCVCSKHMIFKLHKKLKNTICILCFTHLWPWNRVKVTNLKWKCRPLAKL